LVALANIMRLSLKKGAHAALSSAAWQEIRVRSGFATFYLALQFAAGKLLRASLPRSIAGVLRLRAIKLSVCDRFAKRFAQDDGFVWGLKAAGRMQKTRKDRKSQKLSG
jgi:hypothetical protein